MDLERKYGDSVASTIEEFAEDVKQGLVKSFFLKVRFEKESGQENFGEIKDRMITTNINAFKNYSNLPPHACTANFCVFSFYRPTGRLRRTSLPRDCHRNTTLTSSVFRRAAFYQGLKNKVGLAVAKSAAFWTSLSITH